MGIYNFHRRFAPPILKGTKTHAIRADRKYPDRPGDTLHLYTGLRQKGAKLLMRVRCTAVEKINILDCGQILVEGDELAADEREHLAKRDGFRNYEEMMGFWRGRLPFQGQIIHWGVLRRR